MNPYEQEHETLVHDLVFRYLGSRWRGDGHVRWQPDQGFRIHAALSASKRLGTVVFGGGGLIRDDEWANIRMRVLRSSIWAVAPRVLLKHHLEVPISSVLDAYTGRMVFSEPSHAERGEVWSGACRISLADKPLMPDGVGGTSVIGPESFDLGWSRSGIHFDSGSQRLIGRFEESGDLELSYKLAASEWTSAEAWRWPEAARDALGVLLCQQPVLLERSMARHKRWYIDRRIRRKPESARPFALTDKDPIVTKERFVHLANFFARTSHARTVALGLYRQFLAGVRQDHWQAAELLVATALEATLRTWLGRPFKAGDRTFRVGAEFDVFMKKLFPSEAWCQRSADIKRAYFELRDKNAHPDWLFEETGRQGYDYHERGYRQMQLLGQFYGRVILRLSGQDDVQPDFVGC